MQKKFLCIILTIILSGCAISEKKADVTLLEETVVQPIPQPEKPKIVYVSPVSATQVKKTHSLGIIGEIEPVYLPPMKGALSARIDTGAQGSSVDAQNIQEFEREGKKWVSFDVTNPKTGETHHFEKKIYKQVGIKRQIESESRLVVLMTIKIGKEKLTMPFSLADRSKFKHPVLIGRNILKGRAIVDTALSNTLY